MEGKGGNYMGELHPSVKVKGEHHIRPGQCVKVKVSRLHCKALLTSSALQCKRLTRARALYDAPLHLHR